MGGFIAGLGKSLRGLGNAPVPGRQTPQPVPPSPTPQAPPAGTTPNAPLQPPVPVPGAPGQVPSAPTAPIGPTVPDQQAFGDIVRRIMQQRMQQGGF